MGTPWLVVSSVIFAGGLLMDFTAGADGRIDIGERRSLMTGFLPLFSHFVTSR